MSSKHEEIYERYLAQETDFRKLGKDYGVTKERIRQVVDKMDTEAHPLRKPISQISSFRSQLEETAQGLIGKVDAETIGQYNDLVIAFDQFVERLKQIDEGSPLVTTKKDCKTPDLHRLISEYKLSKELSNALSNSLMRSGINNLKDLTYTTLKQIKNINRLGKTVLPN